jgi:hypothetical protein
MQWRRGRTLCVLWPHKPRLAAALRKRPPSPSSTPRSNHALLFARGHGPVRMTHSILYDAIPAGLSQLEHGAHDYSTYGPPALRAHALRGAPPVTCIVASLLMSLALDVAAGLVLPAFMLWGTSACGLTCNRAVARGAETPRPRSTQR